jgi:hypothetical protein
VRKINWTKVKHITTISLGLLAAFAGIAYQSGIAGNEVAPGLSFGVLAGLILVLWSRWQVIAGKPEASEVSTVVRLFHFSASAAGMLVPIVVLVSSKFSAGSKAFIVGGYVSTFLGDLAKVGSAASIIDTSKKIGILLVVASSLLAPSVLAAGAEPTPSDVAPPLSFCLPGTFHCVVPDFNLNTVNYDLGAAKWKAGVTQVGVGYALLFYSDRPWASGVALHGAGQWSQGQPSYFALAPTLVFLKVFEVGVTFTLLDGRIEKDLTLGLSVNAETVLSTLTGQGIAKRLQAAKMAYRQNVERTTANAERRRDAHLYRDYDDL